MSKIDHKKEEPIAQFRIYNNPAFLYGKGLFTPNRRKQLLGLKPKYEKKDITDKEAQLVENQFRYKTKKIVLGSLLDLALFVETASKDDVDQVIKSGTEALERFANFFFHIAFPDQASPERAKVAALFINRGLDYLSRANSKHMTLPNETAIQNTASLVDYFVANIERGENK
jgi:hypothetical protein